MLTDIVFNAWATHNLSTEAISIMSPYATPPTITTPGIGL